MAGNRAVLIFLAGPQRGQRVSLVGGTILVGRSPDAGLRLKEQYVSREQMQFQLSQDGWTVQCLSSRRTRINGKKYKRGKRVLLDTGDVLSVGMETEILFVAPGDDPDAALDAYISEGGLDDEPAGATVAEVIGVAVADDAPIARAAGPKTAEIPPADKAEAIPVALDTPEEPDDEEELDEEILEERKRKAKLKKYLIFFLVYGGIIVGLVVLVTALRTSETGTDPKGLPRVMTKDEIREVVAAKLEHKSDPVASATHLRKAQALWRDRNVLIGNVYRCVKHFRISLAYSRTGALRNPDDLRMYREARKLLLDDVWGTYDAATTASRQGDWAKAKFLFEDVQRMVPAREPPVERDDRIFRNVVKHIIFVKNRLDDAKNKRR
jgi:hypothetical protein